MTIHIFKNKTSGDVYDYTQTHDNIKNGDVLVVVDEELVGVMIEAWPVAWNSSTEGRGAFHSPDPKHDWENSPLILGGTFNYLPAIQVAQSVMFND